MTIQQDVNVDQSNEQENAQANEQENYVVDFRDQLAEQIEASRQTEQDPEPEKNQEQPNAGTQAIEQQIENALIDDPAKHKVKVKLEGQEVELSLADVVAGYQKNEVASRRMTEATKMKQEAEALLNQAKQQPKEQQQTQESAPGDVKTVAKQVVESLLDGDTEAAAETLAKVLEGRGNATQQAFDPNQVAATVKQQLEVDSVLEKFESDYQDVLADPHLAMLTNSNLAAELKSGQHADYQSALKAAGDKTRDWMKSIGAQTQTTTTPKQERVALKESLEQVPRVTASAANQDEPEPTYADVIAEAKKERGFL